VPLPLPLLPLVIVSHDAVSVAVHAQPLVVVTVTLALPPAAGNIGGFNGATVNVHDGAASCVTVTVWPATVIVADRAVGVVLVLAE
jgi:hypothetical protein